MPKSSSLTRPLVGHHHVGRLEVAVDDEPGVGVGDRLAHLDEQGQPGVDAQPPAVGVGRDRPALDQLGGEVRPPVASGAAAQQPRDGRVVELGQDAALGPEPPDERVAEAGADQLDGGRLAEPVGDALGAPDLAHAAAPQPLGQPPRPGPRRRALGGHGAAVEEPARGVGGQQPLDLLAQGPVRRAVRPDGVSVQEGGALGRAEVGGAVEQVGDQGPAVGGHGRGGLLPQTRF